MRKKSPGILAAGVLLLLMGATPAMAQTNAELTVASNSGR